MYFRLPDKRVRRDFTSFVGLTYETSPESHKQICTTKRCKRGKLLLGIEVNDFLA